jgi:hypothetical protein
MLMMHVAAVVVVVVVSDVAWIRMPMEVLLLLPR